MEGSGRLLQIGHGSFVSIESAADLGRELSWAAAGSSLSLSSAPPMAGDAWRSWAENIAAGYAIA